MKTFHVAIETLDKNVFDGFVESVTVPGTEGEMTILAEHMPVISRLKAGTVTCVDERGTHSFPVAHGVLEVGAGAVTILV